MPEYKNGKVYSIRSLKTDLIYIGSTTQDLSRRHSRHKSNFKMFMEKNTKATASVEIMKFKDTYIELIELFPCTCKEELHAREGHFIREMDCVNKRDPTPWTPEKKKEYADQYHQENKEKIGDRAKQWYKDNTAKKKTYDKEYVKKNVDKTVSNKKAWYEKNKERILIKRKERYEKNKDMINAKSKERYEKNKETAKAQGKARYEKVKKLRAECPTCGKEMNKRSITRHLKTVHK